MEKTNPRNQRGFIALTSISIFGAVILVIGVTASISSLVDSRMSLSVQKSARSLSLANLCAENAVWELAEDEDYEGGKTLSINGHSCFIFPVEFWGEDGRIVVAEGEVDGHRKRIKLKLDQIEPPSLFSWEDVIDF